MRPHFLKLGLALALFTGCVEPAMTSRFVKTDKEYQPVPRGEPPALLFDDDPAPKQMFRYVGVLEMRGKMTKSFNFLREKVFEAGARAGCDYLVQRDVFETGLRVYPTAVAGMIWIPGNAIKWQFLCGVSPSRSESETVASRRAAIFAAAQLRAEELGTFCEGAPPLGSHVKKHVCSSALRFW